MLPVRGNTQGVWEAPEEFGICKFFAPSKKLLQFFFFNPIITTPRGFPAVLTTYFPEFPRRVLSGLSNKSLRIPPTSLRGTHNAFPDHDRKGLMGASNNALGRALKAAIWFHMCLRQIFRIACHTLPSSRLRSQGKGLGTHRRQQNYARGDFQKGPETHIKRRYGPEGREVRGLQVHRQRVSWRGNRRSYGGEKMDTTRTSSVS